eukprot:Skav202925  [mRNA]  locus=scaffold1565:289082:289684:- [translate_table: standard]
MSRNMLAKLAFVSLVVEALAGLKVNTAANDSKANEANISAMDETTDENALNQSSLRSGGQICCGHYNRIFPDQFSAQNALTACVNMGCVGVKWGFTQVSCTGWQCVNVQPPPPQSKTPVWRQWDGYDFNTDCIIEQGHPGEMFLEECWETIVKAQGRWNAMSYSRLYRGCYQKRVRVPCNLDPWVEQGKPGHIRLIDYWN